MEERNQNETLLFFHKGEKKVFPHIKGEETITFLVIA